MLPTPEVAAKAAIRMEPDQTKPHWVLVWRGDQPAADLFVEGPDDWVFATHKTAENTFSLAAIETPASPATSVSVHLTLTGPDKSYEFTVPLAVGQGKQ
jgi:hypothetical protein